MLCPFRFGRIVPRPDLDRRKCENKPAPFLLRMVPEMGSEIWLRRYRDRSKLQRVRPDRACATHRAEPKWVQAVPLARAGFARRPGMHRPALLTGKRCCVGALVIFFLIAEPRGLARLWRIGKEKPRL